MAENWLGTWMAAQQVTEPANLPPPQPGLTDTILRQMIRVSVGGKRLRVRISNEYGTAPLTLEAAHVATAQTDGGGNVSGAILPGTSASLRFQKRSSVTIPPGAVAQSDPLSFDLMPLSDVAVTLHVRTRSREITGHPGSRCTSYLCAAGDKGGDLVSAPILPDAARTDHWYFLCGVDVEAKPDAAGAVVTLGDSITDGRGSPTNGNGRWPDYLARRLQTNRATKNRVAVLNAGIGGNCVIRGGLGPPALERLERDTLTRPGARWLIVFEGINDLGTRSAGASDLIAAYAQIVRRGRERGLRVYGATILPCGKSFYFTPELEKARQEINAWIRAAGNFDAIIDMDAALRDPHDPTVLSPVAHSDDHLHPTGAGHQAMADAVDLRLFAAN